MKTISQFSDAPVSVLNRNRHLFLNLRAARLGITIRIKSKIKMLLVGATLLAICGSIAVTAAEVSLESAPPVVVKTIPKAGATDVDPALTEIRVTYSKAMQDGSWSWSTWGEENFPEMVGEPKYVADGRTCVAKMKLQPGKFYAIWLNSDKFKNFKDADGRPAVPYLLTFTTTSRALPSGIRKSQLNYGEAWTMIRSGIDPYLIALHASLRQPNPAESLRWHEKLAHAVKDYTDRFGGTDAALPDEALKMITEAGVMVREGKLEQARLFLDSAEKAFTPEWVARLERLSGRSSGRSSQTESLLNDDQRAVLAWTDRQFRSYFDARTFSGWSEAERVTLETRCVDALKGPRSRDYYQAINTLGALRSTNGLSALRAIAYERADRNNRDRWMAIRSLGLIGAKADVPELIRLVYHGNINTRWWAQLSLVQITGQNFGKDWNAWAKWWDASGGQPAYNPEIIRWWDGQAEPDQLAQSLDDNDQKFFADLKAKAATTQTVSTNELVARLRVAEPTMNGIRENWTAVRAAIDGGDSTNALVSLRRLAPHMQEFREKFQGTSLEAGTAKALELVKSLSTALEKGDKDAAQIALDAMNTLGRNMEEQIKTINESVEPGNK